MKTGAFVLATAAALLAAPSGLAAVQDAGDVFILESPVLKAEVVKATGVVRALERGGTRWTSPGFGRLWLYPPLPHKYGGETATPLKQEQGPAEVTVAGEQVQVKWTTELGQLTQMISASGPALLIQYDLQLRAPAWAAVFKCEPTLSEEERRQVRFLPDAAALTAVYRTVPSHAILQCPGLAASLGLIVPAQGDNDYLALSDAAMEVQVRPLHFERQQRYRGVLALSLPRELPEIVSVWEEVERQGASARPPAQLVKVEADKLIYAPHSTGEVKVTLCSLSANPEEVSVEVIAHRGLGRSESLGARTLRLEPLAQVTVSVPWQLGEQEWGIGLEARLKQGDRVLGTAWDACIVRKDWAQVFQLAIVYPDENNSALIAQQMRENYLSVGHCFAWYRIDGSLTPTEDLYDSHQSPLKKSAPGFLAFNREMHARGLKTNFYWDLFPNSQPGDLALATKDPTIVAYHPHGQPFNGFHGLGTNPYLKFARDWVIENFTASIAMFGWDSMMFDDITYLRVEETPFTAYYMRNWQGELAGKELADDPDTAGEKWLTEVKAGVRAKYPDFVFMGNCLGPEGFLSGTGMGPKTYAATEIPLSELGGGGAEVASRVGVGTWIGLKKVLDAQHQGRESLGLGNRPNYVYIPIPYGGEVSTKGSLALLFANRHHLYGWWPAPAGSLFGQAEAQYLRFATRFCEFLYPDNARWFPPEEASFVQVRAPESVAWREYVYERPRPGGRQLLVHLWQQLRGELMWRVSEEPEMIRDLPVELQVAEGERVTSAWVLSPDAEEQCRRVETQQEGRRVRLGVPELIYYAVVVINLSR